MTDLIEKLSVLDKMNDSILKIVQAGMSMAAQFERSGNTVGTAFGNICGTAAAASTAVDGFAASIDSLRGAADSADTLAGALGGCGDAAEKLARNEDASVGSKAELARAGTEAAEVMYELARVQDEAARAMEVYDAVIVSASASLKELEAAEKRAGHAAENIVEANGRVGSAAEELSKMAEKAAEKAESSGKKVVEAVEGVTAALAAAGIAAKVKEITDAADGLSGAFSAAESIIVKAAGAGREALDELAVSMTGAWAAGLENIVAAVGEINIVFAGAKSELEDVGTVTAEAMNKVVGSSAEAAEGVGRAAKNIVEDNSSIGSAAEEASKKADNGGKKGIDAIVGVANELDKADITAKVEEIAVAAYELVAAFSEAESAVVKATGASGETLDELTDSMMDAFAASKSGSLEDAAAAVGEINTRMRLTGDRLTTVTGQFLDFSEITGTNVVGSVQKATKIMNKWSIDQSEVVSVLDKLAYAGQASGASVDTLSNTVINSSAVFRSLGLDLDNTIGLLSDLEIYGITSLTAVSGLRTAVNNFEKDGLDAGAALREVVNEISNMADADEAAALATETFGSMAGKDFAAAIRSGAISVDSLSQSLDAAQGTLSGTAKTAQTLDQKWAQASNNISAAFTKAIQPTVDSISGGLATMANSFGDFLNKHPIITKLLTAVGVGLGVTAVGITVVSAASLKSIPAIASFGMAINGAILPIAAIAIAIATVTAAVLILFDRVQDETAGMTAATRAQYYEVQNLNAEYDEACEKHGETSKEALRLKYQVDDLTAAYNANRQTMEEFIAEADALCESVSQVTRDFDDGMAAINDTEIGTLALIQKYEDLASQAERTKVQEEALAAVTKKLSENYPDLAAQVDRATLSAEEYVEAMKEACKQQAEEQRYQQAQKTYAEELQKQAKLKDEIAKAEANLNAEREAHGMYYDEQGQVWWNGVYTEDSAWASWTTDLDKYIEELEKLEGAQAESKAITSEIEQGWADMAEAEQTAAEETLSWQDAATAAYEDVKDRVIELCEAYGEAYNAALDSFEGQFGLFDEASMKSEDYMKSTVENAQKALDSQLAYWDSYLANIEVLKNTSAEDLGIKQEDYEALMAYVQDGSEQAAGLAASMTEALGRGDTETVAALANTVGEVNARKQEIAATTADWITNFSSEMDEIEQEMQSAVEGMNLDDEAAKSARETISAYADSIRAGKANAVTAAEEVADAVLAAFYSAEASVNASVNSDGGSSHTGETTNTEGLYIAKKSTPKPAVRSEAVYTDGAAKSATKSITKNTRNSMDYFTVGEDGTRSIVWEQGSPAFPIVKTDGVVSDMNENRGQLQVAPAYDGGAFPVFDRNTASAYSGGTFPAFNEGTLPAYSGRTFPAFDRGTLPALSEATSPAPGKDGRGEQDKNLYIHIGGSEPIEVKGGRANREEIVEVLGRHLKPILMNMIQGEIYEEGDYSYGY